MLLFEARNKKLSLAGCRLSVIPILIYIKTPSFKTFTRNDATEDGYEVGIVICRRRNLNRFIRLIRHY